MASDSISSVPLRLEVLPPAQRRLWDELGATPPQFVLYGGTAIALRLGHRQSVDFDFFAFEPIEPERLLTSVAYLAGAKVQKLEKNTLTCRIDRGEPVSVSFFGLPSLKPSCKAEFASPPGVKLADLLDLAATKMAVVVQRASVKDYLDVNAILNDTTISLSDALGAALQFYGDQFSPLLTLKALTYFGEPELAALPQSLKSTLILAARSVVLSDVLDQANKRRGNNV